MPTPPADDDDSNSDDDDELDLFGEMTEEEKEAKAKKDAVSSGDCVLVLKLGALEGCIVCLKQQ